MAVLADVESVKETVITERAKTMRSTRIQWIVAILVLVLICAGLIYIGNM